MADQHSEDASASLIAKLRKLSEASRADFGASKDLRAEALHVSKQLVTSLQRPQEAAIELCYWPAFAMVVRIVVDLNLFAAIVDNPQPQSAADLAKASGAEEMLIVRLMRALCAIGFVREAGVRLYAPTPLTATMAQPAYAAAHRHIFDHGATTYLRMPAYFASPAANYRIPTDPRAGIFQYANDTDLPSFQYYTEKMPPSMMENFSSFMEGTRSDHGNWLDWFPVRERLLDHFQGLPVAQDFPDQDVLLVDMGGSLGQDIKALARKIGADVQCRLVLQDLPSVVQKAKDLDHRIEAQGHDFFSPQPVKGARTYFLHKILHDWSEESSLSILKHIRAAMRPGYSRLLIHEFVLPDTGASLSAAGLDLHMMAMHAGMERTREQWTQLLGKAAFHIIKIWDRYGDKGVIEAEV